MCVGVSVWLGWNGIRVAGFSLQHRNSNTHRTKNNTTNVVIQQNSRKLLMMDILIPETCWAHKKWNKIASDIKLVFYSSTIKMMHGPINIRYLMLFFRFRNNSHHYFTQFYPTVCYERSLHIFIAFREAMPTLWWLMWTNSRNMWQYYIKDRYIRSADLCLSINVNTLIINNKQRDSVT